MTHWFQWRVLFLLALALPVGFCSPAHSAPTPDLYDSIARALGLAEQGDLPGARRTLAAVADSENPDPLWQAARGIVELSSGNTADAEPFFRAALTRDPRLLAALWGLSLCTLRDARVYEAAALSGRAAALAPEDTRLKALQAYTHLLLGQITDAAFTGKAALDGGEKSPFLMATLAQIHYRMGLPKKAVEFSSFSAKYLYGLDLSNPPAGVYLPLTMPIGDTPAALAEVNETRGAQEPLPAELTFDPPADGPPGAELPRFQITAPAKHSTLRGMQQVRVAYRGKREITFVVLLVDGVLRGLVSELPYHFLWDTDAAAPGEHQLTVRAYNAYGLRSEEHTITVTTTGGKPLPPLDPAERRQALQQQMLKLTMPTPSPLALYTSLGMWHLELKELPQAINALEKSAAIDPANTTVLGTLKQLYKERGLHAITPNGEVVRGPATGEKRVALTFDDGPNPIYTPAIIAELARYDARATFFLVGKMVQRYPDQALQLLAAGHELANHTYHHPNLTKLTSEQIVSEMLLARAVIKDTTGRDTYLFRPPGGNIDAAVSKELRELDYNTIYWSINIGEYVKLTPAQQAAQVLARVQDGSILLLHNGPIDGTLAILPTLLAELHRQGYAFVTVSELMKTK